MHLILIMALWGKYYYYLSLLFGGGNWGTLRLSNFPQGYLYVVVANCLFLLRLINSRPLLTPVLYHRGLPFPRLPSLASRLIQPMGSISESLDRGEEKPDYFSAPALLFLSPSLSLYLPPCLLPIVCLAMAMSPTWLLYLLCRPSRHGPSSHQAASVGF